MSSPKIDKEAAEAIESMKNQLLIVFVERLGGDIEIPVSEIDATGNKLMSMQVNAKDQSFRFVVTQK